MTKKNSMMRNTAYQHSRACQPSSLFRGTENQTGFSIISFQGMNKTHFCDSHRNFRGVWSHKTSPQPPLNSSHWHHIITQVIIALTELAKWGYDTKIQIIRDYFYLRHRRALSTTLSKLLAFIEILQDNSLTESSLELKTIDCKYPTTTNSIQLLEEYTTQLSEHCLATRQKFSHRLYKSNNFYLWEWKPNRTWFCFISEVVGKCEDSDDLNQQTTCFLLALIERSLWLH